MPIDIKPKFIDSGMTTDEELAQESAARQSADQGLQDQIDALSGGVDPMVIQQIQNDIDALDAGLSSEISQRESEDLTFLKLDGSRSMQGNLDLAQNNILNANKTQKKIFVTTPTFTTATNNGSLNLDLSSSTVHFITGTASNFSVVFPNATTIDLGMNFEVYNRSSSPVTLKHFDGSTIGVLSPESVSSLILQDNSTPKGNYSPFQVEVNQAAGVANYNANSNTPFATTSMTYVPITDFVVTPAHGKYAVWFNCSATSTNNNSQNTVALFKNGVVIQDSERNQQAVSSNFSFQLNTLAIIDFTGSEQLQVYVKVTTGTLTIGARTGVALRLGSVG